VLSLSLFLIFFFLVALVSACCFVLVSGVFFVMRKVVLCCWFELYSLLIEYGPERHVLEKKRTFLPEKVK
jgi:hypothetical protein